MRGFAALVSSRYECSIALHEFLGKNLYISYLQLRTFLHANLCIKPFKIVPTEYQKNVRKSCKFMLISYK